MCHHYQVWKDLISKFDQILGQNNFNTFSKIQYRKGTYYDPNKVLNLIAQQRFVICLWKIDIIFPITFARCLIVMEAQGLSWIFFINLNNACCFSAVTEIEYITESNRKPRNSILCIGTMHNFCLLTAKPQLSNNSNVKFKLRQFLCSRCPKKCIINVNKDVN